MLAHKLRRVSPPNISEFGFLDSASQDRGTAASTAFTFAAFNIGAEHPDRIIVVAVAQVIIGVNADWTPTVTINGVTATLISGDVSTSSGLDIWFYAAAVPTGTSVSIVVTPNRTMHSCGIGAWRMVRKIGGVTPFSKWRELFTTTETIDTGGGTGSTNDGHSASLAAPKNGAVIYAQVNTAEGNPAIGGAATKNFGIDIRSSEWFAGASQFPSTESAAHSITCPVTATASTFEMATAVSFD